MPWMQTAVEAKAADMRRLVVLVMHVPIRVAPLRRAGASVQPAPPRPFALVAGRRCRPISGARAFIRSSCPTGFFSDSLSLAFLMLASLPSSSNLNAVFETPFFFMPNRSRRPSPICSHWPTRMSRRLARAEAAVAAVAAGAGARGEREGSWRTAFSAGQCYRCLLG